MWGLALAGEWSVFSADVVIIYFSFEIVEIIWVIAYNFVRSKAVWNNSTK